jgi:copper(I)-binding protein
LKLSIYFLLLFVLFSCGKNNETKSVSSSSSSETQNWARPGFKGQMSGAYFVYKNQLTVPDTLLSVKSPQAMMTQIHESYTTEDGLAGMREKKDIIVMPNAELVLKQGGLHVMLMNLENDLSVNDSVQVSLLFSQAGVIDIILPVMNNKK